MSSKRGWGRYGFLRTIAKAFSPQPKPPSPSTFNSMLKLVNSKLRSLVTRFRWPIRRRPKTRVVVRRFGHPKLKKGPQSSIDADQESVGPSIRVATFNAAMFSMAPAVGDRPSVVVSQSEVDIRCKSANDRPRGILKQQGFSKSKMRVSINLPDNEISVEKGKSVVQWPLEREVEGSRRSERSVLEVLREVGADIIALQNVKAEEEKGMKPLSDLAEGLGMKFVFAESWAPEYGDAVLSKWPIKQWKVRKIFDDSDFRNVLSTTIEVPRAGVVKFYCTHLDHLDENWRMKQINSILQSSDGPHILAGGLNSLDGTDYSEERWRDIVKYYEEIGKPTPKVEVMKFLKGKQYVDAKDFAGECEAVVIVAKGQDVQGTCKYGTRVDYILASPGSPYMFVPGSYTVFSSKGTSDHHIVKADITITNPNTKETRRKPKARAEKLDKGTSKGIWRPDS